MKATTNEQQLLLQLAAHEFELGKTRAQIRAIDSGEELESLRANIRSASENFLGAQTEFENLSVEISRVTADIELVDTRLARDKQRLGTLGSAREAAAVESEIQTLMARKEALETAELEFMEERSLLENRISEAKQERANVAERLSELEARLAVETTKLQATTSTIETQIHQVRTGIKPELLESYDRKSTRGLAVGKVAQQSCGACQLMLTPTALSSILAAPADELPTCPNCDAFLVR